MDPFHSATGELRAVSTSVEQVRDQLERMEHKMLRDAADMAQTIKLLSVAVGHLESGLRDIRLTMTGIGSLAKSLSEKAHSHEEILRIVSEILLQLTQKEPPHA